MSLRRSALVALLALTFAAPTGCGSTPRTKTQARPAPVERVPESFYVGTSQLKSASTGEPMLGPSSVVAHRRGPDADGVITFGELFHHVGREVESKTESRQTPLQATFADHEGGNVALFPPGVRPGGMSAAERIRALGTAAPGSYSDFARLSTVVEADGVPDAMDMVRQLMEGHEAVIRTLRAAFPPAETAGDQATMDLLTQRLQVHEKTAWMLRSLLA